MPLWEVVCLSPMWIAEDLLRAEGFDDVTYLPMTEPTRGDIDVLAAGEADLTQTDIFGMLASLEVVLHRLGHKFDLGAGMAAAEKAYLERMPQAPAPKAAV